MAKHRRKAKPKARPKPKARHGHCRCGEREDLRSLVVSVDGKAIAKYRLCRACTAITCVSLLPPSHGGWAR